MEHYEYEDIEFRSIDEFLEYDSKHEGLREYINGKVYLLASPIVDHFFVTDFLHFTFKDYLYRIGSKCVSTHAPVDLKLGDSKFTPDLMIVCERSKGKYYETIPPLIVEIISLGNASHDTVFKRREYEKRKVREYWLVNVMERYIEVCYLVNDSYISRFYYKNEVIESLVFDGLVVNVQDIFNNLEDNKEY